MTEILCVRNLRPGALPKPLKLLNNKLSVDMCVYVCANVCVCKCANVCMCKCEHVSVFVCVVCASARVQVCVFECVCTCMCVRTRVHMCMCVHARVCAHVCVRAEGTYQERAALVLRARGFLPR